MATISTQLIQEIFTENMHYSRRLLVASPPQYHLEPIMAPSSNPGNSHDDDSKYVLLVVNNVPIDARVLIILSVIFCGLICTLFLNSIIKCAFRSSSLLLNNSSLNHRNPSTTKLATKGIKKKTLDTFPVITYNTRLEHPGFDSDCVICLSKFKIGEKVKILPKCNHCFHVKCIDKWLNSHSSCPTCRHCLIETCPKIVPSDTSSSLPVQEVIVRIEPLQHESVVSSN
ncbi:E3 ubiquitin-protein ligase ATL76-like [Solanum dulcamara]|uniref:E3 ubiquitin-protein ligase ATL76-like n=1 Tax=Solanum dulcamara TaxID=45834 RepID=UPI002484F079|nr:E3 ubiquitin-protein ligase ATL76-like [Solanum dulcamara]